MRRSPESLVNAGEFQRLLNRIKSPSTGKEHYLVAYALRKLGNGKGAYDHILTALRLDPTNAIFITELLNLRACYVPFEHLAHLCGQVKGQSETETWFHPSIYSFSGMALDKEVVALLVNERELYLSEIDLDLNAWEHQLHLDASGDSSESSISNSGTLDNLIGYEGMRSPTLGKIVEYIKFLNNLDFFDNHPTALAEKLSKGELLTTDFGTLLDLAFIESSLTSSNEQKVVFEVGGGYGRLAEGVYQFCMESIERYVLIDSIPGSLAAAHMYLSKHCPKWKIQLLNKGDELDPESTVVICPSWNLGALNGLSPNVVINIESIQEMSKAYERFWVNWINSKMSKDTVVYWSNSRSYKNKGDWYIPELWVLNLISETPRSWSNDHLTALFSLDTSSSNVNFSLKQLFATWKIDTFSTKDISSTILGVEDLSL